MVGKGTGEAGEGNPQVPPSLYFFFPTPRHEQSSEPSATPGSWLRTWSSASFLELPRMFPLGILTTSQPLRSYKSCPVLKSGTGGFGVEEERIPEARAFDKQTHKTIEYVGQGSTAGAKTGGGGKQQPQFI